MNLTARGKQVARWFGVEGRQSSAWEDTLRLTEQAAGDRLLDARSDTPSPAKAAAGRRRRAACDAQ